MAGSVTTGSGLHLHYLVGAVRLASPGSPWARRRYDPAGRKLARTEKRWRRINSRRRRVEDAVAGAPGVPLAIDGGLAAVQAVARQPAPEQ